MSARPISIRILGKEYNVACSTEEQESLISAAANLDRKMREIRDSGKINGSERIAVMVALNIMHDLYLLQEEKQKPEQEFSEKLSDLRYKIENVLENE